MCLGGWLQLGDPAVVWTWSWGRLCAYWRKWLEWNCQHQIEEQAREIERERQRLAQEARSHRF